MSPGKKSSGAVPCVAAAARSCFAVVLSVAFVASAANATTLRRLSLTQVRDAAGTIVIGEVVSSSGRLVQGIPVRRYKIAVSQILRGKAGGYVTVSGMEDLLPELTEGKRYVLFLSATRRTATVGGPQGLFGIEEVTVGDTKQNVLISGDHEPLLVSRSGQIARGAHAEVTGGKLVALKAAAWHPDARQTNGVAENADGSRAPRASAPQVEPQEARYATLDDLRRFISGGTAR